MSRGLDSLGLLVVVAVAHLGPELFAWGFGGRVGSWETVCYGIESACLYGFLACGMEKTRGFLAVAGYGFFESIQRALFRPLFPMDAPPPLKPGQYLADVATGFPVSYLSPILATLVVLVVVSDFTRKSTCKE